MIVRNDSSALATSPVKTNGVRKYQVMSRVPAALVSRSAVFFAAGNTAVVT